MGEISDNEEVLGEGSNIDIPEFIKEEIRLLKESIDKLSLSTKD